MPADVSLLALRLHQVMDMSMSVRHLRYSLRQLWGHPSFTVTVILSLALGIGGSVAVFSVADSILLRPLQFGNEERLVQVAETRPSLRTGNDPVAAPNYLSWKSRNHVFSAMGAARGNINVITGNGRPEQVESTIMSANMLQILGVKPLTGRAFRAEEEQVGARPVAMISAGLWRTRFGSDPQITARSIRLDGVPHAIVGVMPDGFSFHERSQIWLPLALKPEETTNYGSHFLLTYGLLRPGVTVDAARREMTALARQLQREHPDSNEGVMTSVTLLREQLVGQIRPAVLVLAAGVTTILLISCANVAGLLIARSIGRQRELTIKIALGAPGVTLFSERLMESLILACAGGVAGVVLATWMVPLLHSLVPTSLAAWAHPQVDGRALGFALAVSVAAAVGFALAGDRLTAGQAVMVLRSGRATLSGDRVRLRSVLVAAQMALATVTLIGTSLLGQTFWKLAHTDLGFSPAHVLTLRTELPSSESSPYRNFGTRAAFYRSVLERVRVIPGVRSAGYTTFLPLTNTGGQMGILQEGAAPTKPGQWNDVQVRVVSPQYFQTLGMRLEAGRWLSERDGLQQEAAAVISQSAARKYWPGLDPIGRRFRLTVDKAPLIRIVGVSADVHHSSIQGRPDPQIYLCNEQKMGADGYFQPRDLAVLVDGDETRYLPSVRRAIAAVDPEQPVAEVRAMTRIVDDKLAAYQLEAGMFSWFGVASLLLSSIGIHGLLSYEVASRTREIGLRMALGAERNAVVNRFVGSALRLCLGGVIAGGLLSFAVAGFLRSLLFGVTGWDGISRALAGGVVLAVALLAAYLPARRAARVDPMEALRVE